MSRVLFFRFGFWLRRGLCRYLERGLCALKQFTGLGVFDLNADAVGPGGVVGFLVDREAGRYLWSLIFRHARRLDHLARSVPHLAHDSNAHGLCAAVHDFVGVLGRGTGYHVRNRSERCLDSCHRRFGSSRLFWLRWCGRLRGWHRV